ncbi:MAG: EpsG family protein [Muribaculaceae bacterium]|nr:EpsG family protein [Muribaculaceae bacterium]
MEYLIPLFISIIGIVLNSRFRTNTPKLIILGILFVYMVLLMGCRYRVGMDTISYIKLYKEVPEIGELSFNNLFNQAHEPAYILICSIVRSFTHEFWPVQLIMSLLTTGCVFIFLYKRCTNAFYGVFFFLLLQWLYFSTEIIRQSVAIGIFLLNWSNAEKRRWVLYYLISLLSISFHYSAVLIWVLPFVKFLKPNWFYILLCVAILSITPLIETLNKLLFLGVMSEKVSVYVKDVDTVNMNWRIGEFIKTGLPAILAVCMYGIAKLKLKVRPIVLLQILFCCGAFAIPVIFQRFTNYTTLFVTVALANFVSSREVKALSRVFVIGFICMTQSLYYYSMYPTWLPYESIFDPVKNREREEFYRIVW